jgi:hypothetical protein
MIDQTADELTHLGNLATQQGNDDMARRLYEEGLAIWRALDYKPGIIHLCEKLDSLDDKRDDYDVDEIVRTITPTLAGPSRGVPRPPLSASGAEVGLRPGRRRR